MRPVRSNLTSLLAFVLTTIAMTPAVGGNSTPDSEQQGRGVHRTVLTARTLDGAEELPLYGESHALLIGVSRYTDWPVLPSIAKELDAVDEVLSDTGFNVERLVDPDSRELEDGIEEFISNFYCRIQ